MVVILVDAASFGSPIETLGVVGHVKEAGLQSYIVSKGDDIPLVLSREGGGIAAAVPRPLREVGV